MPESTFYHRLIAGETGIATLPLRAALRAAESIYAFAVARRNVRFDRGRDIHRVSVPVISVGNLTVGGTGKTPFVLELARRLQSLGHRPGVVSRGYKATDVAENDEARLVRQRLPDVICVCNPDRVEGAKDAMARGANIMVLDDGFQHRRLARDVDIALIDATCPFGHGHLLPRGLLREPVESLRRADVVALTRCDQAEISSLSAIETTIRRISPSAAILKCRHRVTKMERLRGSSEDFDLCGKRVFLIAGIARPERFRQTVESLGATVVGFRWWPDHHAYRVGELTGLLRPGRSPTFDFLVTTEKDAVKLAALPIELNPSILVLRVDIDFLDHGDTLLQSILEQRIPRRSA